MDTFYSIIVVIALFGGIFLIRFLISKGFNAVSTTANKHILFRSEYKEGQQLVSESLSFESKASVPDIMRQLMEHVAPEETISAIRGGIYQITGSTEQVVYAFGSKLQPQIFVAAVSFTNSGETTQGVFKFLRWKEKEGMVVCDEVMKKLREKVYAAFTAADPSVRVTGTPANSN